MCCAARDNRRIYILLHYARRRNRNTALTLSHTTLHVLLPQQEDSEDRNMTEENAKPSGCKKTSVRMARNVVFLSLSTNEGVTPGRKAEAEAIELALHA